MRRRAVWHTAARCTHARSLHAVPQCTTPVCTVCGNRTVPGVTVTVAVGDRTRVLERGPFGGHQAGHCGAEAAAFPFSRCATIDPSLPAAVRDERIVLPCTLHVSLCLLTHASRLSVWRAAARVDVPRLAGVVVRHAGCALRHSAPRQGVFVLSARDPPGRRGAALLGRPALRLAGLRSRRAGTPRAVGAAWRCSDVKHAACTGASVQRRC